MVINEGRKKGKVSEGTNEEKKKQNKWNEKDPPESNEDPNQT